MVQYHCSSILLVEPFKAVYLTSAFTSGNDLTSFHLLTAYTVQGDGAAESTAWQALELTAKSSCWWNNWSEVLSRCSCLI